MRLTATIPALAVLAAAGAFAPAPAHASRVLCVVNDTGLVTRARAEHGSDYSRETNWDNMAAAQRACFSNITGPVRLRVEYWDFGWKLACTVRVGGSDSRMVSIKASMTHVRCE
ncbi:hypothetical protein [Rubritepida flocculans]|uniref:hypothetical protein n=1 Tax=Rubritepida flocculans TaxID=182403 RepID=UPI00040D1F0A|nr:hypothetical protein [Rubritepida flocculans]